MELLRAAGSIPPEMSGRPTGPVVVGAAEHADAAVGWALRHAARASLPVHLVRAYDPDAGRSELTASVLGIPVAGTREVLARTVLTQARRARPEAGWALHREPTVEVIAGRPVDVLVAAARGASMLVVGHRDGRPGARWGLGSVGLGVLRQATTTMTVVRPAPDDGPVVVGTDGSFDATVAVRHALVDAALRGVRAVVVGAGGAARPEWLHPHLRTAQREIAEEGIVPGPADVVVVDDEQPVPALLAAVKRYDAALLVVGHRGLGHVASFAFGSLGHALVVGAPVPVTVVRADQSPGGA